jgi:hypothetical protein
MFYVFLKNLKSFYPSQRDSGVCPALLLRGGHSLHHQNGQKGKSMTKEQIGKELAQSTIS